MVAIALLALRKTVRYFVKIFIPNEMQSIEISKEKEEKGKRYTYHKIEKNRIFTLFTENIIKLSKKTKEQEIYGKVKVLFSI